VTPAQKPKTSKPWETVAKVEKDTFFKLEAIGSQSDVTLLPKPVKLLTNECKVSWIDWYR